eukprot:SAG31_NODE_1067_length_10080_cov_26.831580_4_plen_285_part_00
MRKGFRAEVGPLNICPAPEPEPAEPEEDAGPEFGMREAISTLAENLPAAPDAAAQFATRLAAETDNGNDADSDASEGEAVLQRPTAVTSAVQAVPVTSTEIPPPKTPERGQGAATTAAEVQAGSSDEGNSSDSGVGECVYVYITRLTLESWGFAESRSLCVTFSLQDHGVGGSEGWEPCDFCTIYLHAMLMLPPGRLCMIVALRPFLATSHLLRMPVRDDTAVVAVLAQRTTGQQAAATSRVLAVAATRTQSPLLRTPRRCNSWLLWAQHSGVPGTRICARRRC